MEPRTPLAVNFAQRNISMLRLETLLHYITFPSLKLLKECELFLPSRKIDKSSSIFPYSSHFFSGKTLDI